MAGRPANPPSPLAEERIQVELVSAGPVGPLIRSDDGPTGWRWGGCLWPGEWIQGLELVVGIRLAVGPAERTESASLGSGESAAASESLLASRIRTAVRIAKVAERASLRAGEGVSSAEAEVRSGIRSRIGASHRTAGVSARIHERAAVIRSRARRCTCATVRPIAGAAERPAVRVGERLAANRAGTGRGEGRTARAAAAAAARSALVEAVRRGAALRALNAAGSLEGATLRVTVRSRQTAIGAQVLALALARALRSLRPVRVLIALRVHLAAAGRRAVVALQRRRGHAARLVLVALLVRHGLGAGLALGQRQVALIVEVRALALGRVLVALLALRLVALLHDIRRAELALGAVIGQIRADTGSGVLLERAVLVDRVLALGVRPALLVAERVLVLGLAIRIRVLLAKLGLGLLAKDGIVRVAVLRRGGEEEAILSIDPPDRVEVPPQLGLQQSQSVVGELEIGRPPSPPRSVDPHVQVELLSCAIVVIRRALVVIAGNDLEATPLVAMILAAAERVYDLARRINDRGPARGILDYSPVIVRGALVIVARHNDEATAPIIGILTCKRVYDLARGINYRSTAAGSSVSLVLLTACLWVVGGL